MTFRKPICSHYKKSNEQRAPPPSKYTTIPPYSNNVVKQPSQEPTTPSITTTLFGSVLQGVGFGAGSSIGHRAIDGLIGKDNFKNPSASLVGGHNGDDCEKYYKEYNKCYQECYNTLNLESGNRDNMVNITNCRSQCSHYLDDYKHCLDNL